MVVDIEYDGCGETGYRVNNLDDQAEIFFIKDDFRVVAVRAA